MSRVITCVYAHNNQEDALRFRDQVRKILRGNKRYISNEILLVSSQPSEEDGNMILQINGCLYYHCVKIVFIYKDQEPTSQSIISLYYRCGDRFHADNSSKCYTSQLCKTDLSVLHKIAKLYYEEFEFGQLDENIIIGPQVGVFPSRRFSTSDVTNTVVDQENLNTKGRSSMTPRHPHSEPAMISWVDILDSLMSKDKEEEIVDNTAKQINELKRRLRTLPDPRYLPNVKYAMRLIDDLNYLLNNKDSVKEDKEKHTYSISSDTLYKAVLKIRAIRDSFSKPGMWVDSQTSCWIHTNKDYETLKVLKTYLECEAKKYVNHPACIIETDMMNHMINLIEDALNLYAVDPE